MKTQNVIKNKASSHFSPLSAMAGRKRKIDTGTFYGALENLADSVTDEGRKRFNVIINQCQNSLNYYTHKMLQNIDDGVLDLLMMGVLWRVYNGQWGNASFRANEKRFNKLLEMKLEYPHFTSKTERIKAKLARRVLDNPGYSTGKYSLENLKMLCMWLTATNEFDREVERMYPWIRFFDSVPQSAVNQYLADLEKYAVWFEGEARRSLSAFPTGLSASSTNAGQFDRRGKKYRVGREDVEKHLNLVGTIMLNRKMGNRFLNVKHQIMFLPGSLAQKTNCQSLEILKGHICSNCSQNCAISKLSLEMKDKGIYTFIDRDESGIAGYLNKWANQNDVGIIASAHVMDLLSLAFEMVKLDMPARCVILEYGVYKEQLFGPEKEAIATQMQKHQEKRHVAFA